jgi:hypothetical protein
MITDLALTTPGLLFSTVSLIMLAYTNRFLAIAKLIRDLCEKYQQKPDELTFIQIHALRKSVGLIRKLQLLCLGALLLSVVSMLFILYGDARVAIYVFGLSLVFMLASLGISVYEISISTKALHLSLSEMEVVKKKEPVPATSLLRRMYVSRN